MGVMTITIDDGTEEQLRKIAGERYNHKKGYLGDAVTEALDKWLHELKQDEISKRQLKLMKKGLYSLKGRTFTKEDMHEH